MKNEQVIKAFLNKENADSTNLHSYNGKLKSYELIIAEWVENGKDIRAIAKTPKLSLTIRKHCGLLYRLIKEKKTNAA